MQIFRDQNKIHEFLNELLSKKESEDLEFKHASGGGLETSGILTLLSQTLRVARLSLACSVY